MYVIVVDFVDEVWWEAWILLVIDVCFGVERKVGDC